MDNKKKQLETIRKTVRKEYGKIQDSRSKQRGKANKIFWAIRKNNCQTKATKKL